MFNYSGYLNDFFEKINFDPTKSKLSNVNYMYDYIKSYIENSGCCYGIFKYHIDGDIKMSEKTRFLVLSDMFNINLYKEKDMKTRYINVFYKFIESLYDDYIYIYYIQSEINYFNTSKNIKQLPIQCH